MYHDGPDNTKCCMVNWVRIKFLLDPADICYSMYCCSRNSDVFQFFRLCGEIPEARRSDAYNLPKYRWEELEDLQPLDVTTTTDMAADWKLIGAGSGV